MGKYGGQSFSVLLIDGYNLLSAKVKGFTHKIESKLEPSTGLGDSWEEHTPTGMRTASLTQDGAFFDDSTNGMHSALSASQGTSRVMVFAYAGNAIGRPFVGTQGVYGMSYDVLGTVGELTKANVAYQVSGAVDRGVILQELEAKSDDWNTKTGGESVDNTTDSADGGVGYLAVSACSGFTNFVGKIRDSADDTTYADLITFTDNVTAPFAERIEVAGTVDRYLCFDGNVTGTGSVTAFCGFSRS